MKIYSYVLKTDDGSAPNPFGEVCTLSICKPAIRRTACIGDWVIGTGSRRVNLGDGKIIDFADSIVYAMKITDIKTLKEYDEYCKHSLINKIPVFETDNWELKVGDCIYDYSKGSEPLIRKEFIMNAIGKETWVAKMLYCLTIFTILEAKQDICHLN